jgi:hypothetical protein
MFADGGVAGLLGERSRYQRGGDVAFDAADKDIFGSSAITVTPDTIMDQFGNQVQAELGNTYNKPLIPQVTEQAANMKQSPLQSAAGIGGLPEIDMPVAGGNKNEMGILPVINQPYTAVMPDEGNKYVYDPDGTRRQVPLTPEEIDRIDMTRPPGTPSGDGALTVMPRYNDPLPKDQLLSGFEEYKKNNPPGVGTTAMIPVTLPGGYDYSFSGSAEANAFRKYLESIGQAPYQGRRQPGDLMKLGILPPGPKELADLSRIGFKVGSMSKRAFLKMLAALGITGAAAKSGILSLGGKQSGKQVVKEVIKTPNVAGKPEWFDSLVNKVIAEGVDKTDDLAYKERMVVHTKKINPNEEVAVYQDLEDGSVRINVGGHMTDKDGNVIRAVNDPDQVDLIVRQGKTEEGGFKTKDSFEASEAEPRVANQDGDLEFDGERVVNNVDDLMQDVSNLEEYATGKKLTGTKKKKAVEKQKKFQKFTEDRSAQSDYLINKYGEGDYASGGIARMLGE